MKMFRSIGKRMQGLFSSCSYGKKVAIFTVIATLHGAVLGAVVVVIMSAIVGVDLKISVWDGASFGAIFAFILVFLGIVEPWLMRVR